LKCRAILAVTSPFEFPRLDWAHVIVPGIFTDYWT